MSGRWLGNESNQSDALFIFLSTDNEETNCDEDEDDGKKTRPTTVVTMEKKRRQWK